MNKSIMRKNIFKETSVLLIAIVTIFSTVTVANTNDYQINSKITKSSTVDRDLVWDNVMGVHGDLGGIIVATVRTEGNASPADDFKFTTPQQVKRVLWQGGYFQCQLAQGQKDYHWDWNIIFWDDCGDGSHPDSIIYQEIIPDAAITREFWYNYTRPDTGNTYWVANYSAPLASSIPFNANTIYWITIQGVQGTNTYPQACWSRHNITDGGILLHEAVIKAAWWGYPDWTNISVLAPGGLPHDLNYQLFSPEENHPPSAPKIDGPATGKPGTSYEFTFNAVDPDGDNVRYIIDWGDTTSDTTGYSASGIDVKVSHIWTKSGTFTIKAKAEDTFGNIGPETTKTVTMPKDKEISSNSLLLKFLERFPILRQRLGL